MRQKAVPHETREFPTTVQTLNSYNSGPGAICLYKVILSSMHRLSQQSSWWVCWIRATSQNVLGICDATLALGFT